MAALKMALSQIRWLRKFLFLEESFVYFKKGGSLMGTFGLEHQPRTQFLLSDWGMLLLFTRIVLSALLIIYVLDLDLPF